MFKKKRLQGPEGITQIEHNDRSGTKVVSYPVLAPGEVLDSTAAASSPGITVTNGDIVRVKVSGNTFIQFSEEDITSAPDATTPNTIQIDASEGGWYLIRAVVRKSDGKYSDQLKLRMRASTAPSRVENLGT